MGVTNEEKLLKFLARRERWRKDPHLFLKEVLNVTLPYHQKKFVDAIVQYNDVSWVSANGTGKTFIISAIAVWFFFCYVSRDQDLGENAIVVFTAPIFTQIKTGMFANIKTFVDIANANFNRMFGKSVCFTLKPMTENTNLAEYFYNKTNYILGLTTDKANSIVGKHGMYVMLIFDEAQGITEEVYSAFNGIKTGGQIVKQILIGNPTIKEGFNENRFYNSFQENTNYFPLITSAFETPNFRTVMLKEEDFLRPESDHDFWAYKLDRFCLTDYRKSKNTSTLAQWENDVKAKLPHPYLINPISAYKILKENGFDTNSYEYITRIKGEFPKYHNAKLFPDEWIQNSVKNYDNTMMWKSGRKIMGVDVGGGRDPSAISVINGNKVVMCEDYNLTIPALVQKIKEVYRDLECDLIKIEKDGIGKPVYDLLLNERLNVVSVMSGASPGIEDAFDYEDIQKTKDSKMMFNRKRDEIWWTLRELLNPNNPQTENILLLPPKKSVLQELAVGTYTKTGTAKIQVMSKDDMRKSLRRSPNILDSIIMACAWCGETNPIELYGFSAFNIKSNSVLGSYY